MNFRQEKYCIFTADDVDMGGIATR